MNGMNKNLVLFIFLYLFLSKHTAQCQVDKAFQHLTSVMDQYHNTYDVYTDVDAGGNIYYPSLIGNFDNLTVKYDANIDQTLGWSCIEIKYNPHFNTGLDWAGVQWLSLIHI